MSLRELSPVIADTMRALAARQLSRMLPRKRSTGSPNDHASFFGPDPDQQAVSGEFSGAAVRCVSQWGWADFKRDPTIALAVLTLFCHLESLTSNFRGFYLHSGAVETLVGMQSHSAKALSLSSHGAELVAAWAQSKMHNWWRRFHFSTPEFQRDSYSSIITPEILPLLTVGGSNRVSVLMILCESYRLNAAAFMNCCDDMMDTEPAVLDDGVETPYENVLNPAVHLSAFLDAQEEHLRYQRHALDDWHDKLPPSELPTVLNSDTTRIDGIKYGSTGAREQVVPLRFRSHDAAMNYAYYVTARIMQCMGFLGDARLSLSPPSQSERPNTDWADVEKWIVLLLRIAAGIDWESCTRLNTYTVGLSGLLMACVLRSGDPATGPWVEDWLSRRHRGGCLEEGGFPLSQILRVLHAVNQERRLGRHVHAVCQPVDDGGGAGKFQSYNSQSLPSILVYGSCVSSDFLYSRHIVL